MTLEQRLKRYHVLAYPTESVYGLGCNPNDPTGLLLILQLKQRSEKKGLILIGSDWEQLKSYTQPIADAFCEKAFKSWPGPYTWLFPCHDSVSPLIRGQHNTIALRVTAHPVASKLCRELGHALVSTSANPEGYPPARDPETLFRYFPELTPEQWIAGDLGADTKPSQIQDLVTGTIIRQGPTAFFLAS